MKNKIQQKPVKSVIPILLGIYAMTLGMASAATVTLVGNGAASGPIFATSTLGNIDLGTRIRVGTFFDISLLNNAISAFKTGASSYSDTLLALSNNFGDLGTGVANYGSASQVGTGVSASQFVFNTTANLAINGAPTAAYNVFTGSIQSVTYSASIGASKNLYIWTAFNNEIGIVRNVDGTGTTAWTTPTSDLSGVTMNLSGINSQAEVLLGSYVDYASGSDMITLAQTPEPSAGVLLVIGSVATFVLGRRKKA
jgi:hypothetical protein